MNTQSLRPCAICGGTRHTLIHRQEFLFPGQPAATHYDVVACDLCGFVYASDIPEQTQLNDFYQAAEHHLHAASVPAGLQDIHADFFDFVRRNTTISPDSSIMDIGCGMGHFLNYFKEAGFHKLTGIEPSPAAVRLAHAMYGITVLPDTIHNYASGNKHDLLTMCGVLEHIADLDAAIGKIATLVRQDGALFIAVPDAGTFGDQSPNEPFLEFALEHINFFTQSSLDQLLARHGFESLHSETHWNDFYRNSYILGLYRPFSKRADEVELKMDETGFKGVSHYVSLSGKRLTDFNKRISPLVASQEPLVVWGAGSLTARLMCTTTLRNANIATIIDRNPQLQGKSLGGIPIAPPSEIDRHAGATVLIASTSYAAEICDQLSTEYHWGGNVVSLPSSV